ncbi:MAG: hypothetical protein EXR27_16525 [Betaproteobacteria bacterium]|nr:hypothetical protein [Betaproteobacteria bacterium]
MKKRIDPPRQKPDAPLSDEELAKSGPLPLWPSLKAAPHPREKEMAAYRAMPSTFGKKQDADRPPAPAVAKAAKKKKKKTSRK